MRAPYQVLVLPFRCLPTRVEFACFLRADLGYWQGIAGGVADGEMPIEAARREALEEAAIPPARPFFALDSRASVPAVHFPARAGWARDTYVIPEYSFGVDAGSLELRLSPEHSEVRWLDFSAALKHLHWHSNQVALWELSQRMKHGALASCEVSLGKAEREGSP